LNWLSFFFYDSFFDWFWDFLDNWNLFNLFFNNFDLWFFNNSCDFFFAAKSNDFRIII
jgi:hypothetical protein